MFDFNKNTKTYHKMQNQETSSSETLLLYTGQNATWTARNRKVFIPHIQAMRKICMRSQKWKKNTRLQHCSVDLAFKNYVKNLGYISPSCLCVPSGPRRQDLVAGRCLLFWKIRVDSWQGLEPQHICSFQKFKRFLLLQTILAQFNL